MNLLGYHTPQIAIPRKHSSSHWNHISYNLGTKTGLIRMVFSHWGQ